MMQVATLETELDKSRLVTLLRINQRLSPDQREALTSLLERRRPRKPPGGPGGGERRGPPPQHEDDATVDPSS